MTYRLEDFERVFEEGFTYQLPSDVRQTIETLTKEVGAPGYVCTPSFEKKRIEFKAPVVKEASVYDDIRKNMNKISDRTFETLKDKIIADIEMANEEELSSISESLFSIASGNAFYSQLYARLYKTMCDTFNGINAPQTPDFVFVTPFEHCNPNENYDRYCEITKTNEQRRALALFCVNLVKEGAVDVDIVIALLDELQERFMDSIRTPETKTVTDELSELFFIVITHAKHELQCDESKWNDYITHVRSVTEMKQTAENGLTSKSIFKHMDLLDATS